MEVQLQLFEGNAISIEIPQRATFEVVDTEPVMKGQTASGSFKPAMLSNGVRTMVPTHVTRHPHRGDDRGRLLCRARERLGFKEVSHRFMRQARAAMTFAARHRFIGGQRIEHRFFGGIDAGRIEVIDEAPRHEIAVARSALSGVVLA